MRRHVLVFIVLACLVGAQTMVVRVRAADWSDLRNISPKFDLDIAGAKSGEYYDLVVDGDGLDRIIGSGLAFEVLIHDLGLAKDGVRAEYLSYAQLEDSLRQLAQDYPSICAFDSLPIPTYEGNWIYGIKISDNPMIEEDDEPGFLIDGTHHAREWACVPVTVFFADSILSAYNIDPGITEIINTTEIYIFPVINVDGYLYDYDPLGGHYWRKNREPFGGSIGTDANRNYPGCSPDIEGDWGAVDQDQASHRPSDALFCGAYANSGDETRALTYYVKAHTINAYMSYHSHGEVIMWPWGWTNAAVPDNAMHNQVGTYMASQVNSLYSGTYDSGPIYSAIYPVSGGSVDWFYSWSHWVGGRSMLSYTTELGTTFYQPVSNLDNIVHQNFKALKYLASVCDSIVLLLEGMVPPAQIHALGNVGSDFTVAWHSLNPEDNHPTLWELVELSGPSVIEDSLESGTGRWSLDGFTLSTAQAHSGTYSFFSGSTSDMNSAVQTIHPYPVQTGDSVTFWCRYDLESNYDVAVVEVSENTKEWFNLDTTRFTGNSSTWVRKAYTLEPWVGRSIYLRFRSMTDGSIQNAGFYVDDIHPVCLFANVDTVSSNITDTLYDFTAHAGGEYYYMVRGSNAAWGWGDYSCLERADVVLGIVEGDGGLVEKIAPSVTLAQNPSVDRLRIDYTLDNGSMNVGLRIFDTSGRLVRDLSRELSSRGSQASLIWDCRDEQNRTVPNGIYFVHFIADDTQQVIKTVIMR